MRADELAVARRARSATTAASSSPRGTRGSTRVATRRGTCAFFGAIHLGARHSRRRPTAAASAAACSRAGQAVRRRRCRRCRTARRARRRPRRPHRRRRSSARTMSALPTSSTSPRRAALHHRDRSDRCRARRSGRSATRLPGRRCARKRATFASAAAIAPLKSDDASGGRGRVDPLRRRARRTGTRATPARTRSRRPRSRRRRDCPTPRGGSARSRPRRVTRVICAIGGILVVDVHDRVVTGDRGAHRVGVEEVDAHRPGAERLEQRVLLGRSRDAGDLVSGGDEAGDRPPAEHARRARYEHSHRGLLSAADNPDTTYPDSICRGRRQNAG